MSTELSPAAVLEEARRFFTGEDSVYAASIEEESEAHLTLATFRSRIAVSAFPDPADQGRTRVRISTLRPDDAIGKFLSYIRTAPAPETG
ncbi:MAG: hypothetical protein ACE5JR_01825 [Gemmatimonadota bacterium]